MHARNRMKIEEAQDGPAMEPLSRDMLLYESLVSVYTPVNVMFWPLMTSCLKMLLACELHCALYCP